jgi:CheY-like chemotaxis protein
MILFVDDDMIYIRDYLEELSDVHDVHHEHSIDKAFKFIIENSQKIKLLVLDMMIPSGDLLKDKDNDNGRRTGRLFIEELKNKIDLTTFPIIVFTHVNIQNIQSEISGISVQKLQKEDFTPYQFSLKVIEVLNSTKS